MDINIHNVTNIEVCDRAQDGYNWIVLRFHMASYDGNRIEEITVFPDLADTILRVEQPIIPNAEPVAAE